jgi:hypothetical protein
VHKAVSNNGLLVPLHRAGQLSDGYLFDPRSLQAFEYACSCRARMRALTPVLRYDHVVGVVRNTRALEDGEVPASTEQERRSAQEACQQYAEANLESGESSSDTRVLSLATVLLLLFMMLLRRCCWSVLDCNWNKHLRVGLQGQSVKLLVWQMVLVVGVFDQRQQR